MATGLNTTKIYKKIRLFYLITVVKIAFLTAKDRLSDFRYAKKEVASMIELGIKLARGLVFLCVKLNALSRACNPLAVTEVRVGGIPPERIATVIPINPNLLARDESDAVSSEYYLRSSEYAGWAGECVVRFRVENCSDRRVSIRGIGVEQTKLTITPRGSMLFIPQGRLTGEVYRFVHHLDARNSASMASLEWRGGKEYEKLPQNYFDESSIEIPPGFLINFAIHIRTDSESFECQSVTLIYESGKRKIRECSIPLPRRVCVYAIDSIPPDQMYRRTYKIKAPWIDLENSERFKSSCFYSWY